MVYSGPYSSQLGLRFLERIVGTTLVPRYSQTSGHHKAVQPSLTSDDPGC
jgi:hypothetical protein